jgi:glycerol-3-phosphate dehydrogenase subunit C
MIHSIHHSPPEQSLDQCIKCNICTTVCPVAAVTDLFPGPKYSGPQAGRFRIDQQASPDKSVDYCSGCRVCNMACPNGVKIAEMNARARAVFVKQGKLPPILRLRNNLVARAESLGKVGQPLAPIANAFLSNYFARAILEKSLRISQHAPLPAFSPYRFTTWFKNHPKPQNTLRQVVYFHGCSTEYYEPRVGQAAVYVLEKNGFEVIIPKQNCCGLPLLSNGEFPAARKYHQNNVKHLLPFARQNIPIVGTSTSCVLTIKEEAPDLLDMTDSETLLVASHIYDINEFLLKLADENTLNMGFHSIQAVLPYHVPCQYKAHKLGYPGVDILRLIPQLATLDSQSDCCGIAGTYGYKAEKYQISQDIGRTLFNFVCDSEAPLVICDSETCRWQIKKATGIPAVHPIELLAASYENVSPESLTCLKPRPN